MDTPVEYKKLIKWLVIITSTIIFVNIVDELIGKPSWQIDRLINVGYEANLPTWFSSMLLAIAAYFSYKSAETAKTVERGKRMLQLLSLGLLVMSCDEVAVIHENLGTVVNKYFFKIKGIEHSTWSIAIGPLLLVIILIFITKLKKYLKNSNETKKFFIIAIIMYLSGALFIEALTNLLNHGSLDWLWKIIDILKEGLEMFGTIFVIKGLISHSNYLLSRY